MTFELYIRQTGVDELSSSQHSHDDLLEIVQILSGSGRILVGDNFCAFHPGDLFVIDAGVIHCTSPDVPAEYSRNKLLFDRTLLTRLLGETPLSLTAFVPLSDSDEVTGRFDRLAALQEAGAHPLQVAAEVLSLLEDCLSRKPERFISDSSISARAITYINENLLSDLSLDSLAAVMHISKFHLSRIFKSETSMTLGAYIQTARLNYAKKQLLFSSASIAQIAAQIGFNDAAAFSKAFTAKEGCAPSAYRRRLRTTLPM